MGVLGPKSHVHRWIGEIDGALGVIHDATVGRFDGRAIMSEILHGELRRDLQETQVTAVSRGLREIVLAGLNSGVEIADAFLCTLGNDQSGGPLGPHRAHQADGSLPPLSASWHAPLRPGANSSAKAPLLAPDSPPRALTAGCQSALQLAAEAKGEQAPAWV